MPWFRVWEHLFLVLCSIGFMIFFGVLLGTIAYLYPRLGKVILSISDMFQTVPALATLGIVMIFIGGNKGTVIIGITLYSLLPIVQNTAYGLKSIPSNIEEAALGMGMSKFYKIFVVDFPLAFPLIFTGIRIATISSISVAVFGTFVGGGGLGEVIYDSIRIQNMKLLLFSTLSLMAMSLVIDCIMGIIEHFLYRRIGIRN